MNPSLIDKLEGLRERYAEVGALLAEPEVASDPSRLRTLAREHAELGPIVECFVSYNATVDSIEDAREILAGADPDLRALARGGDRGGGGPSDESRERAQGPAAAHRPRRCGQRVPGDTGRHRRRRGGAVRRRSAPDVPALRGAAWLALRDREREPGRARRVPGGRRADRRTRGVREAQVRVRRPPRASGCRRRSRRGGSTPRRAPWRCCRRPTRSARSRSTPPI